MARKKLLSEGEIRQFMKLANLRPIGRDRLSEYGMPMPPGARDEEDELRDELDATEDELGDEDAVADEKKKSITVKTLKRLKTSKRGHLRYGAAMLLKSHKATAADSGT